MCPAVAYEMLVSHSPPVFSHSPPASFLADYPSFRLSSDAFPRFPRGGGGCRPQPPSSLSFAPYQPGGGGKAMPASPKRPCLVIRPEESFGPPDEDSKLKKKKVVFADDKGMSLTHVRVMTEPSNVPPLWSFKFLAEVTQGLCAEPEAQDEPWEITFPQPASDYVDFRKRLDTDRVSLENVIVKEAEDVILGTVKVSNISFHKEVLVRSSSDDWKTFEDAFCNYVPNAVTSPSAYVLYDTFSFKIPLPPRARKLEFCVCFRCNDLEHWDNNKGSNYVISKKARAPSMHKSFSADDIYRRQKGNAPAGGGGNSKLKLATKYTDAVHAKLDSWSEFASWTHLETSSPYW